MKGIIDIFDSGAAISEFIEFIVCPPADANENNGD
jgi:hypothetical protein